MVCHLFSVFDMRAVDTRVALLRGPNWHYILPFSAKIEKC